MPLPLEGRLRPSWPFMILYPIVLLGFAIVGFVPWHTAGPWYPPNFKVTSLADLNVDFSFMIALPILLRNHVQYGPDAIFTYGPLGFLMYGVFPFAFFYPTLLFTIALAGINSLTAAYLLISVNAGRALRLFLSLAL